MDALAVFDVDGTLTDTNSVDNQCFLRAVADVLRLDAALIDWSDAPHVTDAGLLTWVCERHCKRPLVAGEVEATLDRFLGFLQSELAAKPERFHPIPGAADVFERVRALGWEVAVATGGWEPSAKMKLKAIGLDPTTFAFASSSDASTRTEILATAIARAPRRFTRIVSIGDGVWDVRAAASAGLPFVGIACGNRAEQLRAAGASVILSDLIDTAIVANALATAAVPTQP